MRADRVFIISELEKLGLKPNRSLGQNFCTDGAKLRRCVDGLGLCGEPVIEIGPGLGALTELLMEKSPHVTAVEKDTVMADYLKSSFSEQRLTVVTKDALRFRYDLESRPFSVAGNLPYYITTSLCERVLLSRPRVFGCMVQEEAKDRFFAGPGEEHYGALSVVTHLYYRTEQLESFPEESFYPAPNVQSVFLCFRENPAAPKEPIEKVFAFVRTCLGMRRKTLKNNIKSIPKGLHGLEKIGIDSGVRAETLTPAQFLDFYRAVTEEENIMERNQTETGVKSIEEMELDDLQPSQFYIDDAKYRKVQEWFDCGDLSMFEPIPIRMLDGRPVMLDGHTRAVAALVAGLKKVPLEWEKEEWDWEMYRRCVRECELRDVHTPSDLIPRIIPSAEYWEKWDAWCDRMQAEVEAERKKETGSEA